MLYKMPKAEHFKQGNIIDNKKGGNNVTDYFIDNNEIKNVEEMQEDE